MPSNIIYNQKEPVIVGTTHALKQYGITERWLSCGVSQWMVVRRTLRALCAKVKGLHGIVENQMEKIMEHGMEAIVCVSSFITINTLYY